MSARCVHGAGVEFTMDGAAVARLTTYFERIGAHLTRREQRESFATYFFGILSEGERKSVEPIAARACGDPEGTRRSHDRLLHFLGLSPWSDREVRREAAHHAIAAMAEREPVTTWIIDDTGFLKQGKHSVGVQRQYTGCAGKITNCQIGVSLSVASRTEHVPIDFALYLPKSWLDSPARCREARIPADTTFKTKPELALDLVVQALDDKLPGEIVLADAAYGTSVEFRNGLVTYGLDYAVGVNSTTKVWALDARERHRGEPVSALDLGVQLGPSAFRRVTWRDGTRVGARGKLSSRFCFRRVIVAHDDGVPAADRDPVWLVIEWPEGEERPAKFTLTTLPRRMSKKQIVRTLKERWRTERAYEELKGELGLDHFEGRSFPGWNHHVSVVLCCYAFVVAERVRLFPPSARRPGRTHALERAA
jgi:SRSO17 transposase